MVLILTLVCVVFTQASNAQTVREQLKATYSEFQEKMTGFKLEWSDDKAYPGKPLELYVKKKMNAATGKGRVYIRLSEELKGLGLYQTLAVWC